MKDRTQYFCRLIEEALRNEESTTKTDVRAYATWIDHKRADYLRPGVRLPGVRRRPAQRGLPNGGLLGVVRFGDQRRRRALSLVRLALAQGHYFPSRVDDKLRDRARGRRPSGRPIRQIGRASWRGRERV